MAEKQKSLFDVPVWIETTAWEGFEEMRRKQRKLLTDRARNCIVNTLWRLKTDEGQDPNAVLDQSTTNCWLDVYPVRQREERRNVTASESKFSRSIRAIREACE